MALLLLCNCTMERNLRDLKTVQTQVHPFCMVCSGSNPNGLALSMDCFDGNILSASFCSNPTFEGYQGRLHGGITASLLDGVMTNRLFVQGIAAVTAELSVRYIEPVTIGPRINLRAWLEKRHPPLFVLQARLEQEGRLKAAATGKFMQQAF